MYAATYLPVLEAMLPHRRRVIATGRPPSWCRCGKAEPQSRRRCGRGEPSPGADVATLGPSPGASVAGMSPVPVQMWQG